MEFSLDNEDIHMNVETILTERIGDSGQAPAHRPQPQRSGGRGLPSLPSNRRSRRSCRPCCWIWQDVLVNKARRESGRRSCPATPTCSGHSPPPLPTTLMAYANMFRRDIDPASRTAMERMDECPLGAGALATSTYPVDRQRDRRAAGLQKAHREQPGLRV